MDYTTDVNRQALLDSHISQVEQQHASLELQRVREEAAGRDSSATVVALGMLEKEHAALLDLRTREAT